MSVAATIRNARNQLVEASNRPDEPVAAADPGCAGTTAIKTVSFKLENRPELVVQKWICLNIGWGIDQCVKSWPESMREADA